MKTMSLYNLNNDNELSNILINGGVVVMPTDTVYGIVCDATNEKAINNIYELKQRDYSKAMIILVSDLGMLNNCSPMISDLEKELLLNSPCPTTVIVERNKKYLPDILVNGSDDVAIRVPKDKELLQFIKSIGKPIVASSANISNSKTITDISLLDDSIISGVDLIVDGGHIDNEASTIVKVIDGNIKILRESNSTNKLKEKYKDKLN